jgi:branched-chain amino acid transport system permease protein
VRLVNLAHGDLMIMSSYMMLVVSNAIGISPYASLIIAMPLMYLVGYGVQKHILNRVLGKGMEPSLIVAFGLSIIIQNTLLLAFSSDAQSLKTSLSLMAFDVTDTLSIPIIYLVGFLFGTVVILILQVFLRNTYMGRAIRAASDDESAAQLMGINTKNIFAVAMGIAMMTAAVAGVLIGTTFTFFPHTGPQYLIIAFGVVIIGGAGSMIGTLAGGFILGLAQLMGAHFFGSGYQLLFGYVILIIVLAFRPQGLFGKTGRAA